jgi:hypothetical protein
MTPNEAAARAETARVYGGLTPEYHSNAKRLPRHLTAGERARLSKALRDQIECTLARTGSIAAAMAATGCTYRTVRDVWRGMAA